MKKLLFIRSFEKIKKLIVLSSWCIGFSILFTNAYQLQVEIMRRDRYDQTKTIRTARPKNVLCNLPPAKLEERVEIKRKFIY